MRYVTRQKAANYKLLLEIRQAIEALTEHCARATDDGGLGIRAPAPDKKSVPVRESHVVNWLLARFLSMPKGDRERFWREGKEISDRHFEADDPFPFEDDQPFGPDDPASVRPAPDGSTATRPVGVADTGDLGRQRQPRGKRQVK